jgi:hypothetical protein
MNGKDYRKIALDDIREDEVWTQMIRRFSKKDFALICPHCGSQRLGVEFYENGFTILCEECKRFRHLRGLPAWEDIDIYPKGRLIHISPLITTYVKMEEYIIELAKKEFGENFKDVNFILPLDEEEDASAEIVIREYEDDDEVLEKLANIYFAAQAKGWFVTVGWVVDNWKRG